MNTKHIQAMDQFREFSSYPVSQSGQAKTCLLYTSSVDPAKYLNQN